MEMLCFKRTPLILSLDKSNLIIFDPPFSRVHLKQFNRHLFLCESSEKHLQPHFQRWLSPLASLFPVFLSFHASFLYISHIANLSLGALQSPASDTLYPYTLEITWRDLFPQKTFVCCENGPLLFPGVTQDKLSDVDHCENKRTVSARQSTTSAVTKKNTLQNKININVMHISPTTREGSTRLTSQLS